MNYAKFRGIRISFRKIRIIFMSYLNIFIDYIKGSRLELKKVNWPTRQDTMRFTVIVIALSLMVAAFLGALDFIFAALLRLIIRA